MDDILIYDSYTNESFLMSKARIDFLRKQVKSFNEQLKEYCIKDELKKPFLQKLYEMFGRGLVICRSSNIFRKFCSSYNGILKHYRR